MARILLANPYEEEYKSLLHEKQRLRFKVLIFKTLILLFSLICLSLLIATSVFAIKVKHLAKENSGLSADAIISNAEKDAEIVRAQSAKEVKEIIEIAKKKKAEAEAKAKAEKKLSSSKGAVSIKFPIKLSKKELDLLYRIVFAEAGNQSTKGQQAVVWTILNRMEDPRFPNSITGIVNAPKQFDPVRNGSINNKPSQKTKDAVDSVLAGEVKDPTGGAQYFCDPSISSRKAMRWFNTLECTVSIGCHHFYKA